MSSDSCLSGILLSLDDFGGSYFSLLNLSPLWKIFTRWILVPFKFMRTLSSDWKGKWSVIVRLTVIVTSSFPLPDPRCLVSLISSRWRKECLDVPSSLEIFFSQNPEKYSLWYFWSPGDLINIHVSLNHNIDVLQRNLRSP